MASGNNFGMVEQAIRSMKTVEDYITVGMETTLDFVDDFAGYNNKRNEKEVNELQNIMLDYVKMERELKQFLQAVEEVKEQASVSNTDIDLESMLNERLGMIEQNQEYPDLKEHEKYKDLKEKIWEIQNPEAVTAPCQQVVVDEDLAMTQPEQRTRCPYTGKDMVIPMKNKVCGHHYDKTGITHYIKTKKNKAKCPVAGCGNNAPIQMSDLQEDKELKRFIERKNKQAGKKSRS